MVTTGKRNERPAATAHGSMAALRDTSVLAQSAAVRVAAALVALALLWLAVAWAVAVP